MLYIVMAYVCMACIVKAFIIVKAYIIVKAFIIVKAYIVMANVCMLGFFFTHMPRCTSVHMFIHMSTHMSVHAGRGKEGATGRIEATGGGERTAITI